MLPMLPSASQLTPNWRTRLRLISAMRTRRLTWMLAATDNRLSTV